MARTDYRVRELVDKIQRGEIQLPEMQRRYVWQAGRVRDLFDSLYRGYPSGVILAWQPPEPVETRTFAVQTQAASSTDTPLLLLDGQQRLTSLSAVLRGQPVSVRGRKHPIDILFNLDHPDSLNFVTEVNEQNGDDDEEQDTADLTLADKVAMRTFVVGSRQIEALPNWVRVADVFTKNDLELLQAAGITDLNDPRYQRYSERLQRVRAIQDYEYRVDILEPSKSYEEVTEIFVRVNSLGAKLRSSDLALAQITAKWHGSLAIIEACQAQLKQRGFELDTGVLVKALIAIITGQSKFLTVGSLDQAQLKTGWTHTERALNFAINVLASRLGIDSPVLLSSPFLIITTAYWGYRHEYQIDAEDDREFARWLLAANLKGRYSRGSTETLLDQDLSSITRGNTHDLHQRLVQQFGRLDVTADDLIGRSARSGAFKTLFIALRADHAADWTSRLPISPQHSGKSDAIEYHHIFPKAYLRRERPDLETHDIDDIANLAFIGADTNKAISDRAPSEYRHHIDDHLLGDQLIDFSDGLDAADRFEDFKARRRQAIAQRLNDLVNGTATTEAVAAAAGVER
jgi:hypothetical protein